MKAVILPSGPSVRANTVQRSAIPPLVIQIFSPFSVQLPSSFRFAAVRTAWCARGLGLGERIRLRLAREELLGRFVDVTPSGALLLDLDGGGRWNVRLDANFQDEVYTNPTNHPLNLIEDYTVTNLRFWWEAPDDEWELAVEIHNATDELYYHDLFDQVASVGQIQAQPALPRTWLLSATRSF